MHSKLSEQIRHDSRENPGKKQFIVAVDVDVLWVVTVEAVMVKVVVVAVTVVVVVLVGCVVHVVVEVVSVAMVVSVVVVFIIVVVLVVVVGSRHSTSATMSAALALTVHLVKFRIDRKRSNDCSSKGSNMRDGHTSCSSNTKHSEHVAQVSFQQT